MISASTCYFGVTVSTSGAEEVQSIIHIKAEKCKNMKHSQDMQLIQKLRDDQKRMKKVFEVMSGRNIVTNSRVTPSWREIVSLTFSEAGVLHVNWISFGHCVLRRELSKSVLGSDLQGEDFAKKMVELVNQRKKHFAEERARAKRNKPMTQSQLRTYMMNYLKNQGTWKLSQLKNLSFEEVKEEFDKLVKQSDEAKGDESTKKTGKRRKQIARKGLHSDKTDEDESEASKDADPISGTDIPIHPVPVAIKPPSIATYKIIKQGEKGVYQIVREDGTDIVYINFGAMLKDITRDDLTELYRIVMNRYGMNGPEDELEKVLWEYLKNMFEEPLSTDPIWSLLGQQRIISWRYYDTCRVHCLNLESMDIYMLIERKYPLSAEVCKAMLDKKLQGGKPDEDCYKMLKMMEKQAGIRK
ncbi:hypothetical protein Tco_0303896 [Tanacetum coccineum]